MNMNLRLYISPKGGQSTGTKLLIIRCVGSGPDFFYASKLVFKILVLEK